MLSIFLRSGYFEFCCRYRPSHFVRDDVFNLSEINSEFRDVILGAGKLYFRPSHFVRDHVLDLREINSE